MINSTLPDDVSALQTMVARILVKSCGSQCTEVYMLRVNQGMKFRQIGEVMGVPASTAHGMFKRVEALIKAGRG
jgi:DNA-directed RNA polymerase specialized sigma24 family protein